MHDPRAYLLGGYAGHAGLFSTAEDVGRWVRMLLNGGVLDGNRLLSPRTLRYMTRNHLPGNADLTAFGRPLFAETRYDGLGFGLGFAVNLDPVAGKTISSPGEFNWGGLASTAFWVDPAEELTVVFMTQLMPSGTFNFRGQLKTLVYPAIVD